MRQEPHVTTYKFVVNSLFLTKTIELLVGHFRLRYIRILLYINMFFFFLNLNIVISRYRISMVKHCIL